ncbi:MAG: hypothetical protein QXV23_04860 [Candidatus Bathyarchaeia archaeon]
MFTRAIKHLENFVRDESVLEQLKRLVIDVCSLKLLAVADLLINKVEEGKKVMVYTKFRRSASLLQRVLWDNYGMLVETFMGGDPASKLKEAVQKHPAVIFTPVAREGLDMPEFDVLIHVSGHADEFTRKQVRGRIRGGEEYYVVFEDTNDEYKLFRDNPEPEGPLQLFKLADIKVPVSKLSYGEYEIGLQPTDKPPYLTIPSYILFSLIEHSARGSSASIGRLGEILAAYHYESIGRRCFKISSKLLRRRNIIGLSPEQLKAIQSIAGVVPNPPLDLLVVGDKTPLVVEVKTTTANHVYIPCITPQMFSLLRRMIKLGIEPVLATVHVRERSPEKIRLRIDRRRCIPS